MSIITIAIKIPEIMMSASKTVKIMSQDSLIDANRRLLLRNGAAIVLSGAAVALLADREALAQSAQRLRRKPI